MYFVFRTLSMAQLGQNVLWENVYFSPKFLSRLVLYFYPVRLNLLMWVCWPNPNLFVLGLSRSVSESRTRWEGRLWSRRGEEPGHCPSLLDLSPAPLHICHNKMTPTSPLLFSIYYSILIGYFNLKWPVLIDRWSGTINLGKLNIEIPEIRKIFIYRL